MNLNVNVINRTVTIAPQCDLAETGSMPFDLNTATLALTPTETAHFYANLNDALLEQNEITNTSNYPNATPYNATIYVRIEDANSCSGISPIQLTVYRPATNLKHKTRAMFAAICLIAISLWMPDYYKEILLISPMNGQQHPYKLHQLYVSMK